LLLIGSGLLYDDLYPITGDLNSDTEGSSSSYDRPLSPEVKNQINSDGKDA
jgi:hypothetical protein